MAHSLECPQDNLTLHCFSNHTSWRALHGFKVFSIENSVDNIETGVGLYLSWVLDMSLYMKLK